MNLNSMRSPVSTADFVIFQIFANIDNNMGLSPLGDLLKRAVQKAGIERQVSASQIILSCNSVLAGLDGKGVRAKAGSYKNGIIKLVTDNGSIAHVLRSHEDTIRHDLKQMHPDVEIRGFSYQIVSTNEF